MNISATTTNTQSALSTLSTKTDDDTAAAKTTSISSTAANPLNKVTQRLQADADSTKAQLSSFGLFKSAVSTLQLTAQKLSSLSATSTESDITTASANLFNTFNAAITAAQKTATGGALGTQSAASASRDLQRAVRADPSLSDAMRKLGMTVQSDGTLQHDAQKFAAALKADPAGVTSALKKIGQQLDTAANKALASTGKVSLAMTALNQRSTALASQQQALSAILQNSQSKLGLSAYLANANY
jgi:flagellar hook-associated protein 2